MSRPDIRATTFACGLGLAIGLLIGSINRPKVVPPVPCPLLPGEFGCSGVCIGVNENKTCVWQDSRATTYQIRPCPNTYLYAGGEVKVHAHGSVFPYVRIVEEKAR